MSSKYPILANRPIDKWKVTELKEELKRRKLTTKGLKDDLIKRLDEALRVEREAAEASEKDEANGFNSDLSVLKDSQTEPVVAEVVDTIINDETVEMAEKGTSSLTKPVETVGAENISEVVDNDANKSDKLDNVAVPFDINSTAPAVNEEVEHMDSSVDINSTNVESSEIVHAPTMEIPTTTVTDSVSTEVVVSSHDSYSAEQQKDYGDSVTNQENNESKEHLDNKDSNSQLDNQDSKPQLECDLKLPGKDLMANYSVPENQVSEVSSSLGSQVKSDSISTNSVSINQKNELKDNIIAENVKLEQEIVRPDMVEEPSSRYDVAVYDEIQPMDVGELHEKKASDEDNNKSPELNKINSHNEDVGYPEKLNFDRSSGDDSMEEDLPEIKQVDSKFDDDELKDKGEHFEVPNVKEEGSTLVEGDGPSLEKGDDTSQDNHTPPVSLVEKRKFHEQSSDEINERAKRQRSWNSETQTVKSSDPQSPALRPVAAPKDEPATLKHILSRSDSSGKDDSLKERIVPPSQRAPTNSLRIDQFLRPFTLKAVQELLGKTGNVVSFWMDQIKTHCYVTYSSVEEATETRNAVYNLQWPPNGGRLLVAEYVDPQEVKMKLEPPPVPVASVNDGSAVPPVTLTPISLQPEPAVRRCREQAPAPSTLPPPPTPQSKTPPAAREQLPPLPENVDQPMVTLDDLFRKTRATPRIYYLPLSEEKVAAKLAARGRSIKK
ncbi:hypothetical protein HN51_013000 [Arachis hypogaea]|uniref:SAP domain-containing protein n=2 Tax=Arachis TaxID=3817 RepID=A0A445DS31_ARAHY|nr:uncharacterized protein LOC107480405 [Arachis duranensis]XP_025689779.1 uncharacterized protein LOC112791247 [Arachis hypogaea]XP_025689780.1 uncharacterized protein LOC112791247 [Arachis hypogaea]QHO58608.1 Apoptotic chromatin condensation inducer in the nucleus [Arachis hypogaea]RYR65992.1 hypothetical protein Ahy_A03g011919 [Arachis hypogaea]